jgi:hypothetical protein
MSLFTSSPEALHSDDERDQTRVPDEVARHEAAQIRRRRSKAFEKADSAAPAVEPLERRDGSDPITDAAGLALSGGGIRSASFNLGLLQAFLNKGFVRWIDYLSTVSGGGFIGTYLSTLLCDRDVRKLDKNLSLLPKKGGRAAQTVERFIRGGAYLRDAPTFADRFLSGFVLNLALWGSLLICLTSGLALFWRVLDFPPLVEWVKDVSRFVGDRYTDLSRPFVPTLVLLVLWAISWPCTCWREGYAPRFDAPRRLGRAFLWWAAFTFLIGLAVLLATDDIQLGGIIGLPEEDPLKRRLTGHTIIGWMLLTFVLLNVLPFLNPVRIFRSELRPPGKMEGTILRVAGASLLVLLPFWMLYEFAREGVSGWAKKRGPEFVAMDIPYPAKFLAALQEQDGHPGPGRDSPTTFPELSRWVSQRCSESLLKLKLPATEAGEKQHQHLGHGDPRLLSRLRGKSLQDALSEAVAHYPALAARLKKLSASLKGGGASALQAIREFRGALDDRDLLADEQIPLSAVSYIDRICGYYLAAVLNEHVLSDMRPVNVALAATKGDRREFRQVVADRGLAMNHANVFLDHAETLRDAARFAKLWPNALITNGGLVPDDRKLLNRLILEATYADFLEQRSKSGYKLNWWDDQERRLWWMLGSLGVFLLLGATVNLNGTSLHGFYRKKVEDAYVVRHTEGRLLKDLATCSKGGPYHFLCATMNLFEDWPWKQTEYSSAYTFFFSQLYCGSQALCKGGGSKRRRDMRGYAETPSYFGGQLDVATATAISGAAFSPAILRSPLLFFMTMLLNVRLGQWLPNPARTGESPDSGKPPRATALPILRDFLLTRLRLRRPEEWQFCFVTDGGHNDNLGISPLIFRRCRLVIISDATRDPEFQFSDFLKAFRRYRIRGGMNFCRLERFSDWVNCRDRHELLELEPLQPRAVSQLESKERYRGLRRDGEAGQERRLEEAQARETPDQSCRHFLLSKLTYGDNDSPTLVIYLKSSMTGDEPADLRQYQSDNPLFPHDPTTDQFFTENQVESYRQLGEHIGLELCDVILKGRQRLYPEIETDRDLWEAGFDVNAILEMLLAGYVDDEHFEDPAELVAASLSEFRRLRRFARERLKDLSPGPGQLARVFSEALEWLGISSGGEGKTAFAVQDGGLRWEWLGGGHDAERRRRLAGVVWLAGFARRLLKNEQRELAECQDLDALMESVSKLSNRLDVAVKLPCEPSLKVKVTAAVILFQKLKRMIGDLKASEVPKPDQELEKLEVELARFVESELFREAADLETQRADLILLVLARAFGVFKSKLGQEVRVAFVYRPKQEGQLRYRFYQGPESRGDRSSLARDVIEFGRPGSIGDLSRSARREKFSKTGFVAAHPVSLPDPDCPRAAIQVSHPDATKFDEGVVKDLQEFAKECEKAIRIWDNVRDGNERAGKTAKCS